MEKWQVINGNNIDILKEYPDNHFDSIVTDPPYGIEFLGKDWDSNTGAMETWEQCYRVLKPGGHMLAFSAARTYHHLATNVEMAGFEIRDQLMWLYGSGFPKAQDIGKAIERREGKRVDAKRGTTNTHEGGMKCHKCNKVVAQGIGFKGCVSNETECPIEYTQRPADNEWSGWKTALKPAHEPIVMARKPFKGSTIDNVLEWGTGAMNIDASRIEVAKDELASFQKEWDRNSGGMAEYAKLDGSEGLGKDKDRGGSVRDYVPEGRYPSNVIMDSEAGAILDKQAPKVGNASSSKRTKTGMTGTGASLQWHKSAGESNGISDGLSGASKFFYCPKVSRKERHIGFEKLPEPEKLNNPEDMKKHPLWDPSIGTNSHRLMKKIREHQEIGNNHPTVKPVELMKYLVKLVTPAGGKVLDPFNGSGSTGMACVELGYQYVGCELDPEYVEIANNRIAAWAEMHDTPANRLFD